MSIYSCTCSESKVKKNFLQSNVVDINFRNDFSKTETPEPKPHTEGSKMIKS